MRAFAMAMSYVGLAVLDFERHNLAGLINWRQVRMHLDDKKLLVRSYPEPVEACGCTSRSSHRSASVAPPN